ncbi:hypothetical protein [Caproiciproducens sp. MSJ-32]|uniref:hypothetical protein n=1 Tax=Caproiciproducens sp. MSJ-32 TaxID=2841527 RepID=UPI001C0F57ED|nr:hypothetical protein [Caproiciproducens sp. MSJ-32]MBU5454969.1 hypothetical protein [Caproiciproducens sp. MSJ-32]
MAGIHNIGNSYNANNKKITSKLSFDVRDKFSGKIIKTGEGNEVVVKLIDGWQFTAELDENITAMVDVLQKFEVEGFENGKLKLKLITKDNEGEGIAQNDFSELATKGSYSKEDKLLLEAMVKFNIPLTKKNIKDIQGMLQFLSRINNNPEEIEKFIQNYLLGKGISEASERGEKAAELLRNFLQAFKNLSKEDILLFLENNLEFNNENIEAYNNIFKGNNKLSVLISKLSDLVNSGQEYEENIILAGEKENNIANEEFTKLKDAINLKYQSVVEENLIDTGRAESENSLIDGANGEIINNKEILNENNISENIISKDNSAKENNANEAIIKNSLSSKEEVEVSISKAGQENKNIIKKALSILKSEGQLTEKVIDLIKNNINEIKLFNKFSEEYYYGQFPVTVKDREYPCKIIVKDNRKKGKKIDSKNVKMVITIDTKNLGTIDSYVTVKDKKINIDLKCNEDSVKIINMSKIILERNIENMGFIVNINVAKKEEEVSLTTCRDFFNPEVSFRLDRKV